MNTINVNNNDMQTMRAPLFDPTVVSQSIIDVTLDSRSLADLSIIPGAYVPPASGSSYAPDNTIAADLGKCRPPSYEQEMNYNSRLYIHNQRTWWEISRC